MENYWDESVEGSVISNGNEILLTTEPSSSSFCVETQNRDHRGSGRIATVFLIVNAALGAGLLNVPQAFDQAGGIGTALTVQAVLLVWIVGALLILAKCAEDVGATNLQEVLAALSGNTGLIACSVVVALYCFGTCVTFLIIIGDQFDRVLSSLRGADFCHYWYMNRRFTISISSVCLILPLCYSRRIDFLKYVSSVGVGAVLYVVALIVYEKYTGGFIPGPIKTVPDHWTDVFLVVPVICFGYQCHVSIIPIYSCLRHRNMRNFTCSSMTAIAVCVICYSIAGVFGYLTFGSNVAIDILLGYGGSNPLVLFGIAAIAIKTFTTYPILLFCGREAVSTLLTFVPWLRSNDVAVTERKRRIIIASIWFFLSLIFSVIIPDIQIVISILGSLAAVFIFIFPGICLLQSTLHRDPFIILNIDRIFILLASLFFLLGAFIIGVVISQIPEEIAKESSKTLLCT
ncbi:hypothetical protein R5R35_014096 [Gryllus longicercus]|uniref:Amino acid transporter transmembrane domain-containing protein n=1 Tax=Gryllus longicercus TaxID=2509291 RepID=A0AAN9Z7C1_9ORTH